MAYLHLNDVNCIIPAQDLQFPRKSHCVEILTGITIHRDTPGLVLICGPVGSAKSSVLATILGGELMITNGSVKYIGTLAYVSDTLGFFLGLSVKIYCFTCHTMKTSTKKSLELVSWKKISNHSLRVIYLVLDITARH